MIPSQSKLEKYVDQQDRELQAILTKLQGPPKTYEAVSAKKAEATSIMVRAEDYQRLFEGNVLKCSDNLQDDIEALLHPVHASIPPPQHGESSANSKYSNDNREETRNDVNCRSVFHPPADSISVRQDEHREPSTCKKFGNGHTTHSTTSKQPKPNWLQSGKKRMRRNDSAQGSVLRDSTNQRYGE